MILDRTVEAKTEFGIIAILRANMWLEEEIERRFDERQEAIKNELLAEMKDDGSGTDAKIGERMKELKGMISGRLIRPLLKHSYLLGFTARPENRIEPWAEATRYPAETIRYAYDHREYPQAFLRVLFPHLLDGDISPAWTDKMLEFLRHLGFARRTRYFRNGYVMSFTAELKETVERWIAMHNIVEPVKPAEPVKPTARKKTAVKAAATVLLLMMVGGFCVVSLHVETRLRTDLPVSVMQIASAKSEAKGWGL